MLEKSLGNYAYADKLFNESISIYENLFSPIFLNAASTYYGYAGLLHETAELDSSREMHLKSLSIRSRHLDKDHPHLANSLNGMGSVMHDMAEYGHAQEMLDKSLEIRINNFGEFHPQTAHSLHNLASLIHDKGNYQQALKINQQALKIRESIYGKDHPHTSHSQLNTAISLHELGQFKEARDLHDKALFARETILGKEHPMTAQALSHYAHLMQELGDFKLANDYYRRSLPLRLRFPLYGQSVIAARRFPPHPTASVFPNLLENPRIANAPAADHQPARPGVVQHLFSPLRGMHIAIGQHRARHRLDGAGNPVTADLRPVHAGDRPTVHGQ